MDRPTRIEESPAEEDAAARGGLSLRRAVVVVLLALAVVVALFGVYELVEPVWPGDRDPNLTFFLHGIRGVMAFIMAAVLVAWLILRASPPLLGEPFSTEARARGGRQTWDERAAHFAHWFMRMRWLAIVVAAVLITVAVKVVGILSTVSWTPLAVTVVALAAMNVGYGIMARRGYRGLLLLRTQVYGDLGALTLLLHFSGGVENPLTTLMLFHVVIAGVVLSAKDSYAVATVGTVLFAAMAGAESSGLLDHYTLAVFPHHNHGGVILHAAYDPAYVLSRVGLQGAILFLTAYFTGTLAERLRHDERELGRFADEVVAQRQMLESALEITGTGLCVCNGEFGVVWANRRWESWFGRALPRAEGSARGCPCGPEGPLEEESVAVTQVTLPDGGRHADSLAAARTVRVTTAPLLDTDGTGGQVVALAQDITEQKQAEAGMIRAERLAAVGELAGRIAHEVNNPVAIISAKARILLADHGTEFSERTAEELRKVVELADRVARIAQGLLSYCRPATGARAPIDIRVPLHKALAAVEEAARTGGVRILERLPVALAPVNANADEMAQVFLNLVVNALDAMPGGGDLTLLARVERPGRPDGAPRVAVVVEDTGVGIREEHRQHIFEPFWTTKPEGRGTGLGLSICLGLVRSHGGEIKVDSQLGVGTRVTVRLPAALVGAATEL
ncbi:MAG: hypothetical protein HY704_02095 [Gemmatimonadetes bacterium]|nr:hypothetical protein [Gemmatimonadota bacterium]